MRNHKALLSLALTALLLSPALSGLAAEAAPPAYAAFAPYVTDIREAVLPTRGIVALGEATHGNREFALLKLEIFKLLVEQSGIRAFALEGDFGGCRKVNDFVLTGAGTADQAAREIGFSIYKTEEMVELLNWMQAYNAGKEPHQQVRFYGFDMQRFDNNKEGLFALLQQGAPALEPSYREALAAFTDAGMYDLEPALVTETLTTLASLNEELAAQKDAFTAASGEEAYDLALRYAQCITENAQLRVADNYGTARDAYMAGLAQWILEFEEKYYEAPGIFLAGHNSHIGKTTQTFGTEQVMGELLSDWYGQDYYAIGTEFYAGAFLAPDMETGERKAFALQNAGDQRLAVLLNQSGQAMLYLDIDAASEDSALSAYLETPQPMSAVGESFSDAYTGVEMAYTQSIAPSLTYDALVFVAAATPSTMLAE